MGSYYLYETDQMCLTKVFIILFTGFCTVTIKCENKKKVSVDNVQLSNVILLVLFDFTHLIIF